MKKRVRQLLALGAVCALGISGIGNTGIVKAAPETEPQFFWGGGRVNKVKI